MLVYSQSKSWLEWLGANIVSMPYKFAVAASNRCHPRCISWCWIFKLVFPPLCLLLPNLVFEYWRLYVLSSCPWPQVWTRHRKYDMCKCFLCWKYALEAIIKVLLLYFFVHDNCLYSCYNCIIRKS